MKKTDAFGICAALFVLAFGLPLLPLPLPAGGLLFSSLYVCCIGLLPFVYAAARRIPWRTFFRAGNFSLRLLAGALLCMAGCAAFSAVAWTASAAVFRESHAAHEAMLEGFFTGYPAPLVFFALTVLPAFCEEVFFRGFVLRSLRRFPDLPARRFRDEAPAVVVCALLFALAHMDLSRFLPAFISGLVLSYTACLTNSLVLPAAMHFFYNAGVLFLSWFPLSPDDLAVSGLLMEFPREFLLAVAQAALPAACAVGGLLYFCGLRLIRRGMAGRRHRTSA